MSKIHINANLAQYSTGRTSRGAKSYNTGDLVASTLEGMVEDELFDVADKFLKEDFRKKYKDLNEGMLRMSLGNRLRGMISRTNKGNLVAEKDAKAAGKDVAKKYEVSGEDQFIKAAKASVKLRDKRIKDAAKAKKAA